MATPLMITVPATDEELATEIEQRLGRYAMRQPPKTLDLETVKLLVEIFATGMGGVAASAGMAVAVTEVIKNLLDIKKQLEQQGRADEVRVGAPGTRGTPLSQVDEALLRKLLGVEERPQMNADEQDG